jgi:hypothetical protein
MSRYVSSGCTTFAPKRGSLGAANAFAVSTHWHSAADATQKRRDAARILRRHVCPFLLVNRRQHPFHRRYDIDRDLILAHLVHVLLLVFSIQRRQQHLPAIVGQHRHAKQKQRATRMAVRLHLAGQRHCQNVKGVFDFPALAIQLRQLAGARVVGWHVAENVNLHVAIARRLVEFDGDATQQQRARRGNLFSPTTTCCLRRTYDTSSTTDSSPSRRLDNVPY